MLNLVLPVLPAIVFALVCALFILFSLRELERPAFRARYYVFALLGVAVTALATAFFGNVAFAQTSTSSSAQIEQWYAYVCGNDGAVFKFLSSYLMYPAFVVVGAALVNNAKWVQASPILGPVARFVGGHWAGWLRDAASHAAKTSAVMLMIGVSLLVAACAGGAVTPIPLPDAKTLFAQACAGISTANGAFQAVSPALLVAGKLSQAQIDQEKATFAVASGRCDSPPVAADGTIDYQALAVDTASDAAAVYLLIAAK